MSDDIPAQVVRSGLPFDAFYVAEFPSMVALAYVLSGSRTAAEGIAQEAMIRAHRHWDRVSESDHPGSWVRRVTIDLSTSFPRRVAAEAKARARIAAGRQVPMAGDPEDEPLLAAMRALPAKQRTAVALFYLEDRPVPDLAAILECGEATAGTYLHRGRQLLAERREDTEVETMSDEDVRAAFDRLAALVEDSTSAERRLPAAVAANRVGRRVVRATMGITAAAALAVAATFVATRGADSDPGPAITPLTFAPASTPDVSAGAAGSPGAPASSAPFSRVAGSTPPRITEDDLLWVAGGDIFLPTGLSLGFEDVQHAAPDGFGGIVYDSLPPDGDGTVVWRRADGTAAVLWRGDAAALMDVDFSTALDEAAALIRTTEDGADGAPASRLRLMGLRTQQVVDLGVFGGGEWGVASVDLVGDSALVYETDGPCTRIQLVTAAGGYQAIDPGPRCDGSQDLGGTRVVGAVHNGIDAYVRAVHDFDAGTLTLERLPLPGFDRPSSSVEIPVTLGDPSLQMDLLPSGDALIVGAETGPVSVVDLSGDQEVTSVGVTATSDVRLWRGPLPDPGSTGSATETGWFEVTGVGDGDALDVRSGPGITREVIGDLAPYEAGILTTGRVETADSTEWHEIHLATGTGWVDGAFLRPIPVAGPDVFIRQWTKTVGSYVEEIEYPWVVGLEDASTAAALNEALEAAIEEEATQWRPDRSGDASFLALTFVDGTVHDGFVSVALRWAVALPGSATGGTDGWLTVNLAPSIDGEVKLSELIEIDPGLFASLTQRVAVDFYGGDLAALQQLIGEAAVSVDAFSVTEDGIRFGWDRYAIAPGAVGAPSVLLPWEEVVLLPDGPLDGLVD